VPYAHIGRAVDLRVTERMIEVFGDSERLTIHLLAPAGVTKEYRTHEADLPNGPRYRQWDSARVRESTGRIGENAVTVVNRIFESVPVEAQGLDTALAVLRLTRRYSSARVEASCQIALASRIRSPRYAHLRPILETGQDQPGRRLPRFEPVTETPSEPTGYVRGAEYYAGETR
jgi:hypothetical protein